MGDTVGETLELSQKLELEALLSEAEDTDAEEDYGKQASKDYEDLFGDDIFGEISRAMYQARYLAPVLMVVGFVVAWSILIAPYARKGSRTQPMSKKDFHMTRPMLD